MPIPRLHVAATIFAVVGTFACSFVHLSARPLVARRSQIIRLRIPPDDFFMTAPSRCAVFFSTGSVASLTCSAPVQQAAGRRSPATMPNYSCCCSSSCPICADVFVLMLSMEDAALFCSDWVVLTGISILRLCRVG